MKLRDPNSGNDIASLISPEGPNIVGLAFSRNPIELFRIPVKLKIISESLLPSPANAFEPSVILPAELKAIEEYFAGMDTPGDRLVCTWCQTDLPGSDPRGSQVRHGVCEPPCAAARRAKAASEPGQKFFSDNL
jgi:hypothetical protein